MMTGRRAGGRFVRVDDGSRVRLRPLDATAYLSVDRPALSQVRLVALARALCDRPVLSAFARLAGRDAVAVNKSDQPALRKDDLPEIMRLTRMAAAPKTTTLDAPSDVRGIWALIDAMRGKKK